jgi:membrane-associated phospholipid phosphatase
MRARHIFHRCFVAGLFLTFVAPSVHAQGEARDASAVVTPVPSAASLGEPLFGSTVDLVPAIQQPAGPPPTPRHTGIKAMVKGLIIDFKYLPSRENLMWAGVGGGLALAVHPLDDNVNRGLVGNTAAEHFFKPGAVLGELPTLLVSASVVYAAGRLTDTPRVSHVGMDLLQSLAMSEIVTQSLKFATRRERPDGSGHNSFPSGHAADTFAFATALERHLGWRYFVPAYTFASYVAISRLPANRHWLSDAVFGSAVGIIAGRTVTSHEAYPFPVAVTSVPGGVAIMYVGRVHRVNDPRFTP